MVCDTGMSVINKIVEGMMGPPPLQWNHVALSQTELGALRGDYELSASGLPCREGRAVKSVCQTSATLI